MVSMKKALVAAGALAAGMLAGPGAGFAACNATVNGQPMSYQQCALATRIYGYVVPGRYAADAAGNWINLDTGQRGNTWHDASRNARGGGYGGSHRGKSIFAPGAVIDGSGGCEGGSCVIFTD